jgi:hypothetical protein
VFVCRPILTCHELGPDGVCSPVAPRADGSSSSQRPEVEAGEGPIPSWPCRRADVLRLLLEKLLLLKILLRRHGLPVDGHGRCEGERVGADELEWRYVEGERVGADGPGWRCVVSGCRYEAGRDPCGSDTNVVKRDREEDE